MIRSEIDGGTPLLGFLIGVPALRVRVAAASEGTLLAEISRLLDNAVQARSRYVQLADRASRLRRVSWPILVASGGGKSVLMPGGRRGKPDRRSPGSDGRR